MKNGKFRLIAAIVFAAVLLAAYLVVTNSEQHSAPQSDSNGDYVIH